MKHETQKEKYEAGFSLFETLVTILIFSLIFMIIGGAFVSSLAIQRRAFNLQAIEENVNFAMEAMAKEIRVSDIRSQDTSCPSAPASTITAIHPVNGTVIYSLNGTAIQRSVNGVASNITSNTIEVTRFNFCISGSTVDDRQQPRITIITSVRSAKLSQRTTIDVQTTLSQRLLSN